MISFVLDTVRVVVELSLLDYELPVNLIDINTVLIPLHFNGLSRIIPVFYSRTQEGQARYPQGAPT